MTKLSKITVIAAILIAWYSPGLAKPTPPQSMPKELRSLLVPVAKKRFQPFHYDLRQDKLTGMNKPDSPFLMRLRTAVAKDLPAPIADLFIDGAVTYRPIIIEPTPEGHYLAFYRDNPPRDLRPEKTKYLARYITADGNELWRLPLNPHLISPSSEIQDVRLRNGVLYFNESCRNLRSPGPKCSTLVALEPKQNKVIWRTPVHVSTNLFVFLGEDLMLAGFGGLPDKSFAYLIDVKTGKPVSRTPLDGAMMYAEEQQGYVHVFTLDFHYIFRLGDESSAETAVSSSGAETPADTFEDPLETNENDPDEADPDEADEHDGLGEENDDHGLLEDVETLRPQDDAPARSGRRGATVRER